MAERYEFHDELLPICLLVLHQTLKADDVAPIFDHYRRLCRLGVRFVAISDVRAARHIPDAATRAQLGEAAARFAAEAKPWSLGSAIVPSSPLFRGALVPVEWISRPAVPSIYFAGLAEAIDWGISTLEAEYLSVPRAVREYRRSLQPASKSARI